MAEQTIEPWLRGLLPDVDPAIGHLLRGSEQIREDLGRALAPLTVAELWARPDGMTPAGFHAKHLAGSTDRLSTYLEGRQLDERQLHALEAEGSGTESAQELTTLVSAALDRYDLLIRALQPGEFGAIRHVGRRRLEVTAIGLAIHIVEHGQRHVGQAISAAKLVTSRREC